MQNMTTLTQVCKNSKLFSSLKMCSASSQQFSKTDLSLLCLICQARVLPLKLCIRPRSPSRLSISAQPRRCFCNKEDSLFPVVCCHFSHKSSKVLTSKLPLQDYPVRNPSRQPLEAQLFHYRECIWLPSA